jgi:hypothetical protein
MTKERMMILEMVDEGKITPDEALALLTALGNASDPEPIRVEWLAAYGGDDPDFPMPVPPLPPVSLIERDWVI